MKIRLLWALTLLLPLRLIAQTTTSDDPLLWSWFGTCPQSARMTIEVRVAGQLRHKSIVPLCHLQRGEISKRQYSAMLKFRFRGGRVFQDEYRTKRSATVE